MTQIEVKSNQRLWHRWIYARNRAIRLYPEWRRKLLRVQVVEDPRIRKYCARSYSNDVIRINPRVVDEEKKAGTFRVWAEDTFLHELAHLIQFWRGEGSGNHSPRYWKPIAKRLGCAPMADPTLEDEKLYAAKRRKKC